MSGVVREMQLIDTAALMLDEDYKARFMAEYYQVKIRYEKLTKMIDDWDNGRLNFKPTCPLSTYMMQLDAMRKYIAVLEARAVMEHIELIPPTPDYSL